MPATKFICPDGVEIDIGSCLVSCRMGRRCLTGPTLTRIASSERPWDGRPSTTRLLNGGLIEYLKAKHEYAINPKDRAFALLGQEHHEWLSQVQGNSLNEQRQQGGGITGTPDILEPDELTPGSYILTDYKTYGSYRVMKLLGLIKTSHLSTTEVYAKSGRWGRAGSPKKITVFKQDPQQVDAKSEELQLNHYRTLLEEAGYPISHMQLQVTVRDGGIQAAKDRGITDTMYLIPIARLPDDYIREYFGTRQQTLIYHMDNDIPPPICDNEESWNKRRCLSYCEVAQFCPQGQKVLAGIIRVGDSNA